MAGLEYANARVKAMKSRLLGESDIKIALEMKSVHDLAVWLEGTSYKPFVGGKTIKAVEKALFDSWKHDTAKVLGFLPESVSGFFSSLLSVFEVEAVKALAGSKISGSAPDESCMVFFSGALKKKLKAMLEAETLESLADVFGRSDYGKIIRRCLAEGKNINTALDGYYFERLWQAVAGLPRGFRKTAASLAGAEIDSSVIINILRSKQRGTEEIPLASAFHRIKKGTIEECRKADSVSGALSVLYGTVYGGVLSEVSQKYDEDKSLFHFEQALLRYRMRLYRRAVLDVLGIGVPISYMKFREMETRHLRSIALGLENGLSRSEIEEMVQWA